MVTPFINQKKKKNHRVISVIIQDIKIFNKLFFYEKTIAQVLNYDYPFKMKYINGYFSHLILFLYTKDYSGYIQFILYTKVI